MKIAIYYDDSGCMNTDLSKPEQGNPGVGGTQFCFLMLMNYLHRSLKTGDELLCYHSNENGNTYYSALNIKHVPIEKLCVQLSEDNVDVALVNVSRLQLLYNDIACSKTRFVIWVHNFLTLDLLRMIKSNANVRRVVFVGKEQYDRYIDDEIIRKSSCIVNMYNAHQDEYFRKEDVKPIVTYTGAIVKGKGFHVLAKEWKAIVQAVPEAQLYVIGGGNLYNRNEILGTYGIASQSYEEEFMPYVTDEQGQVLPSVHFCGILGKEKVKIYQRTCVGVINPTAHTEICPLSAIEMEACGIPVVSKNWNGMPDVIKNNKTGILAKNSADFRNAVIQLLTNKSMNIEFGKNAKMYIEEKFNPNKLVQEWYTLFTDVCSEVQAVYCPPTCNWSNNFKWLRRVNRSFGMLSGGAFSIARIELLIKKMIRG